MKRRDPLDREDDSLMPVATALERIDTLFDIVTGVETVPLAESLGRILAADVRSPISVPGFDNSAMDGWAVALADLAEGGPTRLPAKGPIAAGHPLVGDVERGFAYRIFTGAPIPAGLDAVVKQEDCRAEGDFVWIPDGLRRGDNLRPAGESIQANALALSEGIRLRAQDIGLAASIGQVTLPVRRRLTVALLSTGDEVCEPGKPQGVGQIYDANRYALAGLLKGLGCDLHDDGIVPDDPDALRDRLEQAASAHQLIVTSGGVSVGAEDHVKTVVTSLGAVEFWRLAIKPGKPLALGRVRGTPLLGLPGNPVASLVAFLLFGRPLVARLSGWRMEEPVRYRLPCAVTVERRPGRREFLRARLQATPAGPVVMPIPVHSSAALSSMASADGLIDLAEDITRIDAGTPVPYLPFSGIMP